MPLAVAQGPASATWLPERGPFSWPACQPCARSDLWTMFPAGQNSRRAGQEASDGFQMRELRGSAHQVGLADGGRISDL